MKGRQWAELLLNYLNLDSMKAHSSLLAEAAKLELGDAWAVQLTSKVLSDSTYTPTVSY